MGSKSSGRAMFSSQSDFVLSLLLIVWSFVLSLGWIISRRHRKGLNPVCVESEYSTKECYHSSSGERYSEPRSTALRRKPAEPPEPSWVFMKSDWSVTEPPAFSRGKREPSCVCMKSDRFFGNHPLSIGRKGPTCVCMNSEWSITEPPAFSSGGGGQPRYVSMKTDWFITEPPAFRNGRGRESSCVSVKSDRSIGEPPALSRGGREPSCVSVKSERSIGEPPALSSEGREPSCVSLKSERSIGEPPALSRGGREPSCVSVKSERSIGEPPALSSGGREPSCVSLKSERSIGEPPALSSGGREPSYVSLKSERSIGEPPALSSGGREPSYVFVKSDRSIGEPPALSSGGREPSYVSVKSERSIGEPPALSSGGREPSYVFVKSDRSIREPPALSSGGREPSYVSVKSERSIGEPPALSSGGHEPSYVSVKSDRSIGEPPALSSVFIKSDRSIGEPPALSNVFIKSDRSIGEPPALSSVSIKSDRSIGEPPALSSGVPPDPEQSYTEAAPLQQDSHQSVDDVLHRVLKTHKSSMKKKYESLFEGIKTEENKTLLNRIYTQLYIIEGESEGVNEEHEVLQMEKTPRRHREDTPINCSDIFKPLQDNKARRLKRIKKKKRPGLRSVLTKGIAGIGKTVSVQKFILDWAEEKANQDVDFMFVLSFRELNLIKDHQYSLHRLLCDLHPELKDLDPKIYEELKAVFIFDGLDESRIPLNFEKCEKVSDITMTSSVGVLMTNLIKRELLPSALIWITCRPAAANQIPPKHINRVTVIQGFSDPQKEEYFRKRISDQDQAQKIISHIKTARSLHIMCHIPVFCWISATVLQRLIKHHHSEIPKTLTEMYSHFLITQTNMKDQKYEEKDERDPHNLLESNRTKLLKLAELAFKQLMKGNVIFYEEDLRESGIDITEASVYSGVFTEIFREECVLYQRKVYCFVHLSFQEFLAAVYVFHCYQNKKMKELQCLETENMIWSENVPLDNLLKRAVDKAVESQNGHLDLFLRFLLGISLKSNLRLLQGLLSHTHTHSEETIEYIKSKIKGGHSFFSVERSINLFLCLSEMKDQSLSREVQEYLNSEKRSEEKLSPGQCSALACMLLTSEEVLEELDLKKYNTSEEGYERLIPAVTVCRRAVLADCGLTYNSCYALCSALRSVNSLKELDLRNNDLRSIGVKKLSDGLKSSHCKLETLRLAGCSLWKNSCGDLGSALQSVNSSLRELDLSNNGLQDSGVKLLSAGLKSSHCKLETLRLVGCSLWKDSCEVLCSALQSENSFLKELDLSNNDLQDSGVELLSAGLKSSHCKLETLRLAMCNLGGKSCESLGSALQSVNSSLKELDLSRNDLQDSGVELLSAGLKSSHCELETLRLAMCNLGGKSCGNLGSALQSENFSLKELDLSSNDLQDSGVELLSAGLKSSHCKLETLRLSGCMVSEEGCSSLASALKSNSLHLRELDLTYNHPGESGVKLLSDLLNGPQCKLDKLLVEHGGKIRMKPGLKKYACKLTLDSSTTHRKVKAQNGKVEGVEEDQPYPDHTDRFEHWPQVLSVESLTGRCYWEVECRGEKEAGQSGWKGEWRGLGAAVAVSYRGIRRKGDGDDVLFGANNQSWSLDFCNQSHNVFHNRQWICSFYDHLQSGRVAVYLDWPAGTLSFYSISSDTHTLKHKYTFYTTFTEPLYAGFGAGSDCSVCGAVLLCVIVESKHSIMELHQSSSGGGTSDLKSTALRRKPAEPPEPSCVSEKCKRSVEYPTGFSNEGGEASCVSMKSDGSMRNPPGFSNGGGEASCVSMKSDGSMRNPPGFSNGGGEASCVSMKSDGSMRNPPGFSNGGGEASCVSMKSDGSMRNPPGFSNGGGEASCVSMKSDGSMRNPPGFSNGGGEASCVSMKSDGSMRNPPGFSNGGGEASRVSMKSDGSMRNPPGFCNGGGEPSYASTKSNSSGAAPSDSEKSSKKGAPHTHTLLGGTGPPLQDSHQSVDDVLHRVIKRHKSSMKKKYESLFEGIKTEENKTLLNRIYTQLYIIEGESEGVNEEHEVLQMEKTPRRHREDTPINCLEIFKPLLDHKVPGLRSVLTKGIAGIGKTVSVQKFILDWAEGTANQDVDFMFVLPFRELNLIKDHQYSLHRLLCDFHPELKDLDPKIYAEIKAVLIFDGLDESRIPLNFEKCEKVSDITMTSSVGVLMTNLIKGDLLPSALIWITCRPAAANQIPPKHINRVTEIQGFNDPQKEEYFRKRISDQDQAQKIISHIKTVRSLHIMCHIPVFCWISATVLQRLIKQHHSEIPKTLTEMYSHFLITQTNMKDQKYEEKDERDPQKLLESNRTKLLKLAELAFKQLMKGNVMFYEEDLRESSVDITEASVYSGVFTEIFREECVRYQRKVYCFVHLSFQEFLAAVYVFHCYESEKVKDLQCFIQLDDLLKRAVDKAVESQNGHLDLFLRFLLGISLESNQRLLQGLLTHTHTHSEKTIEDIKSIIKGDHPEHYRSLSTERSINLFLCLSEMKDQSLSREIQKYLNSGVNLPPGQCSALAYMLLTSEEVLEELDLKKYNTSEEGYRRLIPAVTVCRRAVLAQCSLTTNSCGNLGSALQSENSSLKELDLGHNDLQDSGVELLSAGLKSPHCKLETLRLAQCSLARNSCEILGSALQSENSSLKELDLSNNDLQDSGVELLSAGLRSSHCKLETLRLAQCSLARNSCGNLGSVLQSVNSSLKELDLSNNDLQDSGVELLSAGLRSSHCKLETLRLSGCMVTKDGCFSLASALKSNPSHLKELDLTYNYPGESGVKLLSDLLEDPHYKLENLLLEHEGEIWMKPGLKKYACKLTLDPNTAYTHLSLSEGNRKVEGVKEDQPYPDHPDRFESPQVLSVESLTGRCYWEAECSGDWAEVAVSYRGIKRKGDREDSWFGSNDQSWSLEFDRKYFVFHNNTRMCESPLSQQSGRVGVYLDWPAGTLSFNSISPDTLTQTHILTHYTTFTEPLYAGFRTGYDSSVRVCENSLDTGSGLMT
ncbi:uncharacterized protein [Salminus brasiliensis]|uniref:uncharacterized protein n=1 Tax=Salminus brasiliensis TaxID=930266 RepID=UPI003B830FB2